MPILIVHLDFTMKDQGWPKGLEFKRMINARVIVSLLGLVFFITLCYKTYYYAYSFPVKHNTKLSGKFADSVGLDVTDSIALKLDSTTSPGVIGSIVSVEQENGFRIAFINLATRSIYFYDLDQGNVESIWRLDSIGFGRYHYVQGFNILSKDSILVYTFNGSEWTLISRARGKISHGSLAIGEHSPYPNMYPYISTRSPLIYDRSCGNVYFVNYWDSRGSYEVDEFERVLGRLDIKTGEFSNELKFPKEYIGTNWGGIAGLGRESHSFDSKRGLLTISYMFDDSLILYQPILKKVRRVYAGSRFFDERSSLGFHPALMDFRKEKVRHYYEESFIYDAVIHDKFRNKYYRITAFPQEHPRAFPKKRNSIIIMDGDHTLLGEVLLKNQYNVRNFFISEKGLFIQRSDLPNDEFLRFDCFSLTETPK